MGEEMTETINLVKNYFVGFIDILGFKNLFKILTLEEIYKKVKSYIKIITKRNPILSMVVNGRPWSRPLAFTKALMISDSVFIYREDNTETAMIEMTRSLRKVFQKAFMEKIWLRASVAYGPAIIIEDSDGKDHILIGESINNAVEIEKSQEWMGCSFHTSCRNYIEETHVVEWNIPFKEEFNSNDVLPFALDWVDSSMGEYQTIFQEWITENEDHSIKKENTKKFFMNHLSNPPCIS